MISSESAKVAEAGAVDTTTSGGERPLFHLINALIRTLEKAPASSYALLGAIVEVDDLRI